MVGGFVTPAKAEKDLHTVDSGPGLLPTEVTFFAGMTGKAFVMTTPAPLALPLF